MAIRADDVRRSKTVDSESQRPDVKCQNRRVYSGLKKYHSGLFVFCCCCCFLARSFPLLEIIPMHS